MILSYSQLVMFNIFSMTGLLVLLMLETHRANKLADKMELLEVKNND